MNIAYANTLHSSDLTSTRIPFANASNILVDSASLTFDTSASELRTANFSATGNIAASSTITAATLSATGNVYAGNVSVTGDVHGTTLTGSISSSSGSQANITSVGTLTSLSVSGTTHLGPIANVHISDGSAGQYITSDGSGGLSWDTLDLSVIDNGTSNVSIPTSGGNVFINVGGTEIIEVDGTGANITGTIDVSGNVVGNNLIADNKVFANAGVDSTSSITGTAIITGGIGATGNIYTGKSIGFANNNGGTASKAYIQFNDGANSLDFIFD